jgi:hypothetical protein
VPAVPTNIGINGTRFSRQSGTEPVPATIDQVTGTGGATDMTRDTFIARTAGKISWIVSEYDRWTINEQQQLVNTQTGI